MSLTRLLYFALVDVLRGKVLTRSQLQRLYIPSRRQRGFDFRSFILVFLETQGKVEKHDRGRLMFRPSMFIIGS